MDQVNFTYNRSFALTDISLEVRKGSWTGIIGPNGSGKSTLVKLMAGYLKPVSGKIYLGEEELSGLKRREIARQVAVVTQGLHTDYDFTVEEMVGLGRLPYLGRWQQEGPGDGQAVDWALATVGLEAFRHRPYRDLSGGEAQRVLLAQALAQQPVILLLDEPTTYLDMANQQEMFSLLTKLHREGATVVAVLHDVNMASLYCEELMALRGGRIFAQGPPEVVITRENILALYGSTVAVNPHPVTGRPQVTMLP